MIKINIKQWVGRVGLILIAFFLAFFIDQYYVAGKGVQFLIDLFSK